MLFSGQIQKPFCDAMTCKTISSVKSDQTSDGVFHQVSQNSQNYVLNDKIKHDAKPIHKLGATTGNNSNTNTVFSVSQKIIRYLVWQIPAQRILLLLLSGLFIESGFSGFHLTPQSLYVFEHERWARLAQFWSMGLWWMSQDLKCFFPHAAANLWNIRP